MSDKFSAFTLATLLCIQSFTLISNVYNDNNHSCSNVYSLSLCVQSIWKTVSSNQESSVLQSWCECPEVSTRFLFCILTACTPSAHRCFFFPIIDEMHVQADAARLNMKTLYRVCTEGVTGASELTCESGGYQPV